LKILSRTLEQRLLAPVFLRRSGDLRFFLRFSQVRFPSPARPPPLDSPHEAPIILRLSRGLPRPANNWDGLERALPVRKRGFFVSPNGRTMLLSLGFSPFVSWSRERAASFQPRFFPIRRLPSPSGARIAPLSLPDSRFSLKRACLSFFCLSSSCSIPRSLFFFSRHFFPPPLLSCMTFSVEVRLISFDESD